LCAEAKYLHRAHTVKGHCHPKGAELEEAVREASEQPAEFIKSREGAPAMTAAVE
jgi:hypothetical protein